MGLRSGGGGRWRAVALSLAVAGGGVATSEAVRASGLDVVRSESCLRQGITRVLELREGPAGGLPCEVVYLKPDEDGSARVMWLARNERAFCTTRFESFVVKLETELAWECEPDAAVPPASGASSPTNDPVADAGSSALPADPVDPDPHGAGDADASGAPGIAERSGSPDESAAPSPSDSRGTLVARAPRSRTHPPRSAARVPLR